MKQNPLFYAVGALAYIIFIVLTINFLTKLNPPGDNLLIPIVMLSLLVMSVAVMAFLFGYRPFFLYFDGRQNEAVIFFIKTLGWFATLTAVVLAGLIFLS